MSIIPPPRNLRQRPKMAEHYTRHFLFVLKILGVIGGDVYVRTDMSLTMKQYREEITQDEVEMFLSRIMGEFDEDDDGES